MSQFTHLKREAVAIGHSAGNGLVPALTDAQFYKLETREKVIKDFTSGILSDISGIVSFWMGFMVSTRLFFFYFLIQSGTKIEKC